MRALVAAAVLLLVVSSPLTAQDTARQPALRVGSLFDADLAVKVQVDWRRLPGEPSVPAPHPAFDLRRARIGLHGTLLRRVDYQVERNLHETSTSWADVYANVALPFGAAVRGGRFKIPFSLEQLTSATELDFAYRALAAAYLAPGRDVGAMVHGSAAGKRIRYQAGVFRAGGDNVRRTERDARPEGPTLGGRVVLRPFEGARAWPLASRLAVGVSVASGDIPEGPHSLRGHTYADDPLFQEVNTHGRRRRLGGELEWRYGPVSLSGERIQVSDQRLGEGTDNDDLTDVTARGWYAGGTWLLTGERKTDRVTPARPLLRGGVGAIELAARVEGFRFGSLATDIPVSRDRRARSIAGDSDRAVTVGVNWYLTRAIKVQLNAIREEITRRGGVTSGPIWSRVVGVQFVL